MIEGAALKDFLTENRHAHLSSRELCIECGKSIMPWKDTASKLSSFGIPDDKIFDKSKSISKIENLEKLACCWYNQNLLAVPACGWCKHLLRQYA